MTLALDKNPMTHSTDLNVQIIPIDQLSPFANNPRTHNKKQIRQIADSLKAFGWTNPILADDDDIVVAGHGRLLAAEYLGMSEVPVIRLSGMTEAQKRAYVIADNRLAEKAGWDEELLAAEFEFLAEYDLDFDLELTGFETGEIDVLLGAGQDHPDEEPVELPDPDQPPVSRLGDLWQIGSHQILCGNALDEKDWEKLLGDHKAQMVFTDPPYNVVIDGNVSGLGKVKHREFAMASGEMEKDEFIAFLSQAFALQKKFSTDGSIHYICMDWRHLVEVQSAAEGIYSELKNLCVWVKTNAGMGSFYRSQHEMVFVFKAGQGAHINNFGLGETGRHRSNVWTYAGANTFRPDRAEDLEAHPTVKPISMVADAILDCSTRNGLVMDAFAGSGTTLVAAHRTGRRGAGIEIDPAYCDLIVKRLERETGEKAILAGSGEGFSDVAAMRLAEAR